MEQFNRSRPPPPGSSSSPWKNALPYNASLSEEGSYGSFALFAPSPLLSPAHLFAGKDPSGLPFPSRNDLSFSENRGLSRAHLTRSASSTEGLRRHRRPLSELLSTPDGPPSPLPAASVHRRPSLSSLMAGSLDFDRPPRSADEEMHPLHSSHTRHQSASYVPVPPFPHGPSRSGSHYNPRASHYGFLSRASSDRFDLDPMIRSSFDQQAYHAHLDPMLTSPLATYHSNGTSHRKSESAIIGNHEIGGANFCDNLISEHSYKEMQYLRSRSNIKSQDMNAPSSPLSPSSSYGVRQAKQTRKSLYDVNVHKKATMRDMLADADGERANNHSMPHHHPPQVPFKHPLYDKNGASRFSFEHYNKHAVPVALDHRYHADNNSNENHHFDIQDPPLYVKSYGVAAQTHSLDQNSAFIRDPTSQQEQRYKGSNGLEQGKVSKNSNSQDQVLVNACYDPVEGAQPRFEMNWSGPNMGMASHAAADPRNEMRASSVSSDGHVDMGSYSNAKQNYTESSRKEPVLTKGQSILDNVTENIVRKLTLLSYKYKDMSFSEAATSSAKLLFKRALLVQLQALAPKLAEICADEEELVAHRWALQGSSIIHKQSQLSHQGLCLLHLQKILYDIGTSTFDILMTMRTNLYGLLMKPSVRNELGGQLRIACVGGAPGCVAIALRLFFVVLRPSCEVQVDMLGVDEQSKQIVEELSFRDIKCAGLESGIQMVRRNPGMMRYYKMLMLVNCMGGEGGGQQQQLETREQWKSMWDDLYENAGAGAVVVVYESVGNCRWEDIAPSTALWQFASLPRSQDCARVGRKHDDY